MRIRYSAALIAAACLSLGTVDAHAQVIPNVAGIKQTATGQANRTSAQIRATERTGNEEAKTGPRPAEAAAASAAVQKGAPAAKGAPAGKGAPQGVAAKTPVDSGRTGSASQSGGKNTATFYREVFTYSDEGRRDPFVSLMASDEGGIRPLLVDLSVIGIIYDPSGHNSFATVVDGTNAKVYNIHVGSILGRMKVLKIDAGSITLNLDEFGFSRQETLLLSSPTRNAGRRP